MNRKTKFIGAGVIAAALLAVGVATSATAAPSIAPAAAQPNTTIYQTVAPRPAVGKDAKSNLHVCLKSDKTYVANGTLDDGKCGVGTYGMTIQTYQPNQFGEVFLNVQRGSGALAQWGNYSTVLGSPTGDNAGGVLRMTCRAADVSCKISVQAFATVAGQQAYPRVLIDSQSLDGGSETYCEYGDGVNNAGDDSSWKTVGTSPTDLTLGVGGSLDCKPPTQTIGNGTVSYIEVPPGYYNISTTVSFRQG